MPTNKYGRFSNIEQQLVNTGLDRKAVSKAINDSNIYLGEREVNTEISACNRCKLSCSNKVHGCGSIKSPLMVLGEGPGRDELATGVPLIGAAGTFLIMTLNSLGVYRGNVYMTNATKCNKEENGKLQTPDMEELETCRSFLMRELKIVRPQVILAMGNPALRSITGDYSKKISAERGNVIAIQIEPGYSRTVIIPTWHPSYVIRQKGPDFDKAKNQFWNDVRKAIILAKEANPYYLFDQRPIE
jgi:DNA polymerase